MGMSLAKSQITTNKGHLVLEKSDRVGEGFSRFYPINSFIPQSAEGIPPTTPPPHPKPHSLIQCKWKNPIAPETKEKNPQPENGGCVEEDDVEMYGDENN